MFKNRRIVLLLIFVVGVGISFWAVSRYPALSSKAALSGTDAFEDPLTHEAHFAVPDIAVATDNGFKLYQNINGRSFKEIRWPYDEAVGKQTITSGRIFMWSTAC